MDPARSSIDDLSPTTSFLDAARQGRSSAWRYLSGFQVILFCWFGLGGLLTLYLFNRLSPSGLSAEEVRGWLFTPGKEDLLDNYLLINAGFLPFLLGTILTVWVIHRRSPRTLVTIQKSIYWRRIAQGGAAWFLLAALAAMVEYVIWPSTFYISFQPAIFLPFALMALILTPIQTTAEELFFRGYLMQAASLFNPNHAFLAFISSIIFMLFHIANPEIANDFWLVLLYYLGFGIFLALISLKDGGLELALGVHVANNLFSALLVSYQGGSFVTPAVFFSSHQDSRFNILAALVCIIIFYCYFFFRNKLKNWIARYFWVLTK